VPVVPTNGGAAAEEPVAAAVAPTSSKAATKPKAKADKVKPLPRAGRLKRKKK
jgi:hypothetical protein